MSRNSFVVGDGFVINERALSKVGCCNNHAARTFPVGRACDVVSCCRGLEGGYRFDGDRGFGKKSKKLRQFRLHLRYVMAKIVENLFGRSWNVFGIGLERGAERGEIGK